MDATLQKHQRKLGAILRASASPRGKTPYHSQTTTNPLHSSRFSVPVRAKTHYRILGSTFGRPRLKSCLPKNIHPAQSKRNASNRKAVRSMRLYDSSSASDMVKAMAASHAVKQQRTPSDLSKNPGDFRLVSGVVTRSMHLICHLSRRLQQGEARRQARIRSTLCSLHFLTSSSLPPDQTRNSP